MDDHALQRYVKLSVISELGSMKAKLDDIIETVKNHNAQEQIQG